MTTESGPRPPLVESVTVTLTPAEVAYLAMLCDIDDDPENAKGAGIAPVDWASAHGKVFAASEKVFGP